jgi:hypothetical protein
MFLSTGIVRKDDSGPDWLDPESATRDNAQQRTTTHNNARQATTQPASAPPQPHPF